MAACICHPRIRPSICMLLLLLVEFSLGAWCTWQSFWFQQFCFQWFWNGSKSYLLHNVYQPTTKFAFQSHSGDKFTGVKTGAHTHTHTRKISEMDLFLSFGCLYWNMHSVFNSMQDTDHLDNVLLLRLADKTFISQTKVTSFMDNAFIHEYTVNNTRCFIFCY